MKSFFVLAVIVLSPLAYSLFSLYGILFLESQDSIPVALLSMFASLVLFIGACGALPANSDEVRDYKN